MMDKKDVILRAAISLFAQKGYHATSMQEIAEASGVAKGTLYTYFQSKDELLYSIFKKYYHYFDEKIKGIEARTDLSPKEKFYEQIYMLLSEMMNVRDFLFVYMREQFVPEGSEFRAFIKSSFRQEFDWLKGKIIALYGEPIRSHASDLAVFFQGILKQFFVYVLFHSPSISIKAVCDFAFRRLEDAIEGSVLKEKPLLTEEHILHTIDQVFPEPDDKIFQMAEKIKERVSASSFLPDKRENVIRTIEVILREWKKEGADKIILSGLFLYLKRECPETMKREIEALEQSILH